MLARHPLVLTIRPYTLVLGVETLRIVGRRSDFNIAPDAYYTCDSDLLYAALARNRRISRRAL